ncbi:deaminase domain-containing protein [Flagellimonas baculiformis]|uniref:deaminase domain-containing protein n=1 Tax=Flagellimonas baculiformis TaxID=3067310 RepID=UPI00296F7703|nr:deaminase domain-containing protein [Muricauda sp. D6]
MRTLSMKRARKAMISVFCLLLTVAATAQSYPVQVLAQSTPPTPVHFSDFANTNTLNGPLRVQIVLNDLQISNRQVRLQVSFNGNGIGFTGRETVVGAAPLFLEGGLPIVLDHTLLAPYFEFANLEGISPNAYGAPIPDGAYQVCFEVFDVLTGKRLSNNACTILNVFKNSPPLLVLPQNDSDLVERSPQNIVFQWTPRHINVGQVEYDLSLVEIWDNALDPQAAFLGSNPLFTATTSATTYVYGPSDPMLLPNRTYAWRVRAKAKQGAEDIGMFENQGHSQIFSFKHIEGCHVPHGIRHEIKGAHQANVLWDDPSTEVPRFTVRYRAKGDGNQWFLNRTTANWTTLWDLRAGTTYEYQLKKTCTVAESDWSPIRQFTTHLQTEEDDLYQCGMSPDVDIANQDPLPDLGVGESFTAGDFQVVVTEVSGGNGYFTGRGHTRLPYLNNIKLAVHFTNILVNTDRQLAQGTVITEFDPTMGNIVDTGDVVQTVGEFGGAVVELASSIRELLQNFTGTPEQIEQLQTENEQQDSYVKELLADETIPQNVRNQLAANHNAYNAASQDLIDEATQGGPNPEGYNTANQQQAYNDLEASIQEAESYRNASSNADEIAFDPEDALALEGTTETNIVVYLSPAGVPVALSGEVPVEYYKVKNGITAYGALQSFTIEDGPKAGEYKAHKKGNEFTGYKINTDSAPYDFGALPDPNNIFVRTIDQGLGCSHLLLEGHFQPTNLNTTGEGTLVTDWGDVQWDLLPIEKQGYTTCLPPLDYDGFAEYVMGAYNPFGYGGFLRKVVAMDGSVAHVYSIADQENGWMIHYQYNRGNGKWDPIEVPEYNVDTAAALDYLFGQVFSSAAGHLVLDAAGMVPVAGEVFDVANGVWYTIEGDGASAAISFASTIPLVYATTVKNAGKIVKLANGTTVLVKFSKEATERLVDVLKRLDLDAAQLQKLSDDLTNKEFAEAIAENPELVDIWKFLDEAGVSNTLRKNVDNLDALDAFKKANPNVSDEAIKNALTSLKSSRRQAYLNGLKNVADNNVLSLTNKRLANPDEVKDALNSLRDFRKNNPSVSSSTNVGALDGTINGTPASQLSSNPKWVSGANDTPLTEAPVWSAQNATGSSGASWLRDIDSEYKMLNDMARKLEPNAKVGDVFSSHAGEIKIISEIPYCTSCSGIIQNFNEMFPNIKVVLIDGIK